MNIGLKRVTLLGIGALLLSAGAGLATDETGDGTMGSGQNQFTCHSDNISDTHTGAGSCVTWLSCSADVSAPKFQYAPFPIAAAAGATGGGCFTPGTDFGVGTPPNNKEARSSAKQNKVYVRTAQAYTPNLELASRNVDVFTAKKDGNDWVLNNRSNPIGMYGAGCHEHVPPPTPVTPPATPTHTEIGFGDNGLDTVAIEFDCSVTYSSPTYTYTYTVTNNLSRSVSFSWPAVRTPDHTNGWSDSVDANDTKTYVYSGTSSAVRVWSHATDLTYTSSGEVFATHSSDAVCPTASVTRPTAVSGLVATAGTNPRQVVLAWTNHGPYDTIKVRRGPVGSTEAQIWTISASSVGFVDSDPPSGTVEYTVYGVEDDVAADSNPSESVVVL